MSVARIFTITNQKGGVGKTTTAAALAGGLVKKNYRVLVIDLDPQGNLGFSIGADIETAPTIHDVLKGKLSIVDAIQRVPYCDVVTSNILLSGSELEFSGKNREQMLKEAIRPVIHYYDYIIIDTPPALNFLTINAYTAATDLIIPMMAEILSLHGVAQLKETIFAVKKHYNHNLMINGILLTKYNPRMLLTQEVEELVQILAEQLGTRVYKSKIYVGISVAEAPAHCLSLMDYAPHARSTLNYIDLIDEILTS